jgi:hypothetical protein
VKKILASPRVQTGAILLVAGLLLWLTFRGSDLSEIRAAFLAADRWLFFWALVATMGTYVLRAIRWQVLLSPLGRAGLVNCFSTTVIGFMVNFLAGRLGEIARPYLLARREGFSASGAFATIVLERVLDLVTVVFLIGFWLLVGLEPAGSEEVVTGLKVGGVLGLAGAVVALAVMFFFARYPDRSLAVATALLRFLPKWIESRLVRFLETFRAGLGALVEVSMLAKSAVLSVLLWLNVALAFWLVARAFGVEFVFGDTFLVIGFLTVGVAVPTPGAIGGYHYMCARALTGLFGAETATAQAVALAAHAVSFLPVTFLGILLFAKAGLNFKTITTSS